METVDQIQRKTSKYTAAMGNYILVCLNSGMSITKCMIAARLSLKLNDTVISLQGLLMFLLVPWASHSLHLKY